MRYFIFVLLLTGSVFSCQAPPEVKAFEAFLEESGTTFDVWIRNARVVDGTGAPAYSADLLIRDGEILYLGWVAANDIEASEVIDASQKTVTPGFIDAHAHGDPLRTPAFENFLRMGVTSICLGQDGSSVQVVDLPNWLSRVDSIRPGVNIIPFIGHGTIRRESGIGYQEDPEEASISMMAALLEKALEAGCFGLSTGLEYTPGTYASEKELNTLAKVLGSRERIMMSHIRNEDNDVVWASLEELLALADYCAVHASHLKVVYGKGAERAEEILDLLFAEARAHRVTADLYPYMASYTGIGIVFPAWAKPPANYEQVKKERRMELLNYLRNKIQQRNGPEATLLGTAPYAGQSLADLEEEQDRPYEEILLDIGPGAASGAYFIMDASLQERLLQHPQVVLSSDGSPTMRHPRGYGSFAKMIETYVLQDSLFSLETAVHKMSGQTADILGLKDRGTLAPGQKADLLIFDPLAIKAQATYAEPHQYAQGFEQVLVNGQIVIRDGQIDSSRYGKCLRYGP
ncbi:MAG TPA: amidohydrolase family protein [Saprospiraceae bacterium]|nr:amidohydrolase family protein [Saprospiraceae bacterium]